MKKAYITVFYAVSMALLLSFFMVLVNGLTFSGARLKSECAVDTALTSQFADYNSVLWKEYGLIFVDSAYGESKGGIRKAQRQLKSCINRNFDEEFPSILGGGDLYGLRVDDCKIKGIRFASDNGGLAIAEQSKLIMEYKYGAGLISEINSFLSSIDQYEISPNEYINKAEDASRRLTGEYDIHDYQGWVNSVTPGITDSDEYSLSAGSILRKAVSNTDILSRKTIKSAELITNHQINRGNLVTSFELSDLDKLIFKEYLFQFLSSYLSSKENRKLSYQSEFVIYGKHSDIQNLELSAKQIMFIRLAADIASLLSDSDKMGKIRTFSEIVASLVGFPEAAVLIETVIVAGWSYWESLADLKVLFAGKKVPFIKAKGEWLTSLSGIFSANASFESDHGLTYRDYIHAFIFLSDYETLMNRFLSALEIDIRKEKGYEAFRIDNCYDYIETDISVSSKRGFSFDFNRLRGVSHN